MTDMDTLLLVEDDRDARTIYADFLSSHGYRVVTARNADAGIHLAVSERPALIITDLSLPRTDGYTAMKVFKQHPVIANTPVIAITASNLDSDRERAFEAGCDAFLGKPFLPVRLLREIERMLGEANG